MVNYVNTMEMTDSRSGSRGPYHWGGGYGTGDRDHIYIYTYIYTVYIYMYTMVSSGGDCSKKMGKVANKQPFQLCFKQLYGKTLGLWGPWRGLGGLSASESSSAPPSCFSCTYGPSCASYGCQ